MAGGEMVERWWECPKCGVIVNVTEVLPPLEMDAEKIIERKMLILQVKGLDKIMKRFRLGLPFFRLGCWLAGMDLELQESQIEARREYPPFLYGGPDGRLPDTAEEIEEESKERRYSLLEDYVARLKDLDEWQEVERQRLVLAQEQEASTEEGAVDAAELVLGDPKVNEGA